MNHSDLKRNSYMLRGVNARHGYMRWWHSFRGTCHETGITRTFFIEYFLINPGLGNSAPILGQHPSNKKRGIRPSYAMLKVGVMEDENAEGCQLHAFYPISSLKVVEDPLYIKIEDCIYTENRIQGSVIVSENTASHPYLMTDAGSMEWDLEVHKSIACHTGILACPLFNWLNALDSFWHGEGIRTAYKGNVTFNGEIYDVTPEESYGYADKHWGRKFNNPLLTLAGCKLTSKKTGKELKYSAVAIDGCRPRFLWFPLRPALSLQITYTGEDFTFLFAKPWRFSKSRWSVKETKNRYIWHIKAQSRTAFAKVSLSAKKDEELPLRYELPNGDRPTEPILASGTGIGTIELYRLGRHGKEYIDTIMVENALCISQKIPVQNKRGFLASKLQK